MNRTQKWSLVANLESGEVGEGDEDHDDEGR
jgi:hypothetical protein